MPVTAGESSAARLLALLSLLQSRPRWTATELADRLTITTRTVRRDITRLRELGYPVDAEAGSAGGYQLGSGGSLPPLLLTDDEAVAVAIGLRAAASGGVAGYDEAAVAALTKLEQVLPARLRESVLALTAAAVIGSPAGPAVDSEILLAVAQACKWQERLRFAYVDGNGNQTDRRVEPYGLVSTNGRWYLVADDLDRRDWRTFRLDRMTAPELTGHRFVRTKEPDTAAMVAAGLAVLAHDWQAEVMLFTSLEEATKTISATVGTLEPVTAGTLLRIGADDLDWIARYLAGLPFEYDVRHPDELRAELRTLGRRLQQANRVGRDRARALG